MVGMLPRPSEINTERWVCVYTRPEVKKKKEEKECNEMEVIVFNWKAGEIC